MDFQARMAAMLAASPEVLEKIDAILEGRDNSQSQTQHTRLLRIGEGCRFLGWSYSKMKRAIEDGLVDVADATGARLIREESLYELAEGRRKPSAEVLARREARNAARREAYRLQKARLTRAVDEQ